MGSPFYLFRQVDSGQVHSLVAAIPPQEAIGYVIYASLIGYVGWYSVPAVVLPEFLLREHSLHGLSRYIAQMITGDPDRPGSSVIHSDAIAGTCSQTVTSRPAAKSGLKGLHLETRRTRIHARFPR